MSEISVAMALLGRVLRGSWGNEDSVAFGAKVAAFLNEAPNNGEMMRRLVIITASGLATLSEMVADPSLKDVVSDDNPELVAFAMIKIAMKIIEGDESQMH